MRILIIEDELHLSEALAQILKKINFTVDTALDGEIGLDNALTGIYDLILLDIMLPKIDGLSILKELRKENINTPVLLLTARNQIDDKVRGLNLGADDYLAKPFAQEELIARIHALLRRKENPIIKDQLCVGDIILNYQNLTLSCNNKNINLTLKESELLQFLIIRKPSITPKDLLIEKLWGFNSEADDNNVEVYISFIRKKLKHLNSNVFIKTSRGLGYSLEVNDV